MSVYDGAEILSHIIHIFYTFDTSAFHTCNYDLFYLYLPKMIAVLETHKIIKKCVMMRRMNNFLLLFLLQLFYDFGCSQLDLIGNVHFKVMAFFHIPGETTVSIADCVVSRLKCFSFKLKALKWMTVKWSLVFTIDL